MKTLFKLIVVGGFVGGVLYLINKISSEVNEIADSMVECPDKIEPTMMSSVAHTFEEEVDGGIQ